MFINKVLFFILLFIAAFAGGSGVSLEVVHHEEEHSLISENVMRLTMRGSNRLMKPFATRWRMVPNESAEQIAFCVLALQNCPSPTPFRILLI